MESEMKRYYKNEGMALRVENSISGERLLTRVPFPPLNKELLLLQTFLGEERERREREFALPATDSNVAPEKRQTEATE